MPLTSMQSSRQAERARPIFRIPRNTTYGHAVGHDRASSIPSGPRPVTLYGRSTSADARGSSLRSETPRDRAEVQKSSLRKEIEAVQAVKRFPRARSPIDHPAQPKRKLFIVSMRLPFRIVLKDGEERGDRVRQGGEAGDKSPAADERFSHTREPFETNVADLVGRELEKASLAEVVLVGAPVLQTTQGTVVSSMDEDTQKDLEAYVKTRLKCVPVFFPPNRERFGHNVLFPLFHYSPPSVETGLGLDDWEGYELTNQKFSDAVLQDYKPGDLVWINDYPLMLLPKFLRQERPDIHIGFYLHCVFPSSEIYRILPQREDLLRGVLSANLIGFHNFQYVRHFLTSCTRVLGLECSASGIEACEDAGGTHTKVIAAPLGINLEPFRNIFDSITTKEDMQKLEDTFKDRKIIVAIDRLEEKKGIPHKIMAFHKFLQDNKSWVDKCVFVQIADYFEAAESEDTEDTNEERAKLLQQVYQMVGEVNSKLGVFGHLPIHFLDQRFSRAQLVPLLAKADVVIDTSLRDLLSRAAYEFLYVQGEYNGSGVLIMSEFSGSAQSLRAAALCVNPWDTVGFADAIREALEMESDERNALHSYGNNYVQQNSVQHWACNFLTELQTAVSECETERLTIPHRLDHENVVAPFRKAARRIIVLGFSGTLLPRSNSIKRGKYNPKINPKLPEVLETNLRDLVSDPNTHVVILSGFERTELEQAFANIPCWIIAEGGVCYREPGGCSWHEAQDQQSGSTAEWLGPAKEIMSYFAARTPGSYVVEMSSSVSWHYQKTQGDHAAIQSKDLLIHLWAGPLLSAPAEVVVGNDSVCVRPTGVGKSSQLEAVLRQICCDDGPMSGAATPLGYPGACTSSPGSMTPRATPSASGPGGGQLPPRADAKWLAGDSFVICISDLLMRDEDVFLQIQKFFDRGDKKQAQTPGATYFEQMSEDFGGHRRSASLSGLEPAEEQVNLETNSKSLGADDVHLFNKHRIQALQSKMAEIGARPPAVLESFPPEEDGPFGLHKAGGSSPVLQSIFPRISQPVEGEWQRSTSCPAVDEEDSVTHGSKKASPAGPRARTASDLSRPITPELPMYDPLEQDPVIDDQVALYTCTVRRKSTRAMYHLIDTDDVAFLIAKLARQVRQAIREECREATHAPSESAA